MRERRNYSLAPLPFEAFPSPSRSRTRLSLPRGGESVVQICRILSFPDGPEANLRHACRSSLAESLRNCYSLPAIVSKLGSKKDSPFAGAASAALRRYPEVCLASNHVLRGICIFQRCAVVRVFLAWARTRSGMSRTHRHWTHSSSMCRQQRRGRSGASTANS